MTEPQASPRRHLGVAHATILALGMIMSTDTLKTASTVALNLGHWHFYMAWVLGGLVSMVGAFSYVEMATAFPDPGGDYRFLTLAYGRFVGLIFAWSRFSIMHTGWIALMAFLFADYVQALVPMGAAAHALFAGATVAALTGLNLTHVRLGFLTQALLVVLVALGFAAVVAAGITLWLGGALPTEAPSGAAAPGLDQVSVAFIYIFLAYGGWSDAAVLSAEIRNTRAGMAVTIIGSLALLILIYLSLNAAMAAGLGMDGLARSQAPAAELLARAFGPVGETLIVAVVGISAIASINSTLIVGARTTYAAARDVPALARLGTWESRGVPARAVLAEGAVALALVGCGSLATSGFNAMVNYMTPVYWCFLMLSTGAVIILRIRHPEVERPVRTPFYPVLPGAFFLVAFYMFGASLADLGVGALAGAAVMALGAVLAALALRAAPPRLSSARSPG